MKKLFVFILIISIIFSVVACKGSLSGHMTAEEIMEKLKANYENAKSMTVEFDISFESSNDLISKIEMKMTFDMISEPLQIRATVQSVIGDMELYAEDDKMYMQDPVTKEWMEISREQANLPINPDTSKKLINLNENYIEKFKVSEKDGLYYLTMQGSGEDIPKDLFGMAANSLPDDFTVKNIKVEYILDKDTFLIDVYKLVGEFEASDINDEKVNMKVDMKMRLSNLDEIDKIEIPKEVLELQ